MNDRQTMTIAAAIIALVLLACLGLSLGLLFLLPSSGSQPPPSVPPGQPPPVVPGPGQNGTNQSGLSQEDLETWAKITKPNVESICLQKAKEEAQANAGFVYGCTCDETLRADQKNYDCSIDTADPFTEYFANIDCYFVGAYCVIETNYGTQTYTFAQLRELE